MADIQSATAEIRRGKKKERKKERKKEETRGQKYNHNYYNTTELLNFQYHRLYILQHFCKFVCTKRVKQNYTSAA